MYLWIAKQSPCYCGRFSGQVPLPHPTLRDPSNLVQSTVDYPGPALSAPDYSPYKTVIHKIYLCPVAFLPNICVGYLYALFALFAWCCWLFLSDRLEPAPCDCGAPYYYTQSMRTLIFHRQFLAIDLTTLQISCVIWA